MKTYIVRRFFGLGNTRNSVKKYSEKIDGSAAEIVARARYIMERALFGDEATISLVVLELV